MYTSSFAALKTRRNREIGLRAFMGPGQTLSDSRFLGQKHCQRRVQPPWWEPVPFWVLIFQLDNSMRTGLEEPPENSLETDCVYGCGYGYRQASVYTCVYMCVYTVTGKWGSPEILSGVHPPVTGVHDGSCQIDVPGLHRHSLGLLCSMLRQHFSGESQLYKLEFCMHKAAFITLTTETQS